MASRDDKAYAMTLSTFAPMIPSLAAQRAAMAQINKASPVARSDEMPGVQTGKLASLHEA